MEKKNLVASISLACVFCVSDLVVAEEPNASYLRDALYVGIVEQREASWSNGPSNEKPSSYKYVIRISFKKIWKDWEASYEWPSNQEWNWFVAFDGRNIGRIKSVERKSKYIAAKGLHEPTSDSQVPVVGRKTTEFNGWAEMGEVPLFRPLVLVSRPNYADPQNWKPYQPSELEVNLCIPQFREAIGSVIFCDKKHGTTPTSDYERQAILVGKSYRSSEGEALIALNLDPVLFNCDVSETGGEKWFHINDMGQARLLDVSGRLLDAGDYDGDGTSEIIFFSSGYNRDGYVMLYDNLTKQVEHSWSYH